MTDRGQLSDPPAALADAAAAVIEAWLVRCVADTAAAQLGACPPEVRSQAESMAAQTAPEVTARLRSVLAADVDDQRAGPLATLRTAVVHPTAVLAAAGVPEVARDEFECRAFPEDRYRLSPATWADVDPSLHEPGIVWGAWKAATVLQRRRAEGKR